MGLVPQPRSHQPELGPLWPLTGSPQRDGLMTVQDCPRPWVLPVQSPEGHREAAVLASRLQQTYASAQTVFRSSADLERKAHPFVGCCHL